MGRTATRQSEGFNQSPSESLGAGLYLSLQHSTQRSNTMHVVTDEVSPEPGIPPLPVIPEPLPDES